MNFKIGDRVVIVRSPSPRRVGLVTTIISGPHREIVCDGCWWYPHLVGVHTFYELDASSTKQPGSNIGYPPSHLELYRPDDREKAEWTESLRKLCGLGAEA